MEEEVALQSAWLLSQVNSHKSKVVEFERKVILQVEDIWRLEKMGLARVVEGIRQALGHVVKEGTTSAPKVNKGSRTTRKSAKVVTMSLEGGGYPLSLAFGGKFSHKLDHFLPN